MLAPLWPDEDTILPIGAFVTASIQSLVTYWLRLWDSLTGKAANSDESLV